MRYIGIDFGTDSVRMAALEGGAARVLPNGEGGAATPGALALEPGGAVIVGREALQRSVMKPGQAALGVKRRLGTDEAYQLSGRRCEPVGVMAAILRKLIGDAEARQGERFDGAVLALPACFTQAQRAAVREGLERIGITDARFITDTAARALALGEDDGQIHNLLVCDLGGGFCGVSVIQTGNGVTEVLSHAGDSRFGGAAFDARLMEFVIQRFRREAGLDVSGDALARARLSLAVKRAREELSERSAAQIYLPYIASDALGARHLNQVITREQFEALTADLAEGIVDLAIRAIQEAMPGITGRARREPGTIPEGIDRFLLAGGLSRTPFLRRALVRLVGLAPQTPQENGAALGAALMGGIASGELKGRLLLEATGLTTGFGLQNGGFDPVIWRNTTLPAERGQVYTTSRDGQTELNVSVAEGDGEQRAPVGRLRIAGIPPAPRGEARVLIGLEQDVNGFVSASARLEGDSRPLSVTAEGFIRVASASQAPPGREAERPPAEAEGAEALRQAALREAVLAILPTVDNLERALAAGRAAPGSEAITQGVELTLRGLMDSLKGLGLEEIPALNAPFDPRLHEAVARENGGGGGVVTAVLTRGFRLNGRVLRPAQVRVSM